MYMAPVNTVEVQILQVDTGIIYTNETGIYFPPAIQGQIVGCQGIDAGSIVTPLTMYCLQLDTTNYFDETAPVGATHPFPASGDTTGYVDLNVWFPNCPTPLALEPVVFWNTDVGIENPPVAICSAGNTNTYLVWSSSAGIDQLSVMFYAYGYPFRATPPP